MRNMSIKAKLNVFRIFQSEVECFSDIFALIERELQKCEINSVAMKTVEALDGKF